MNRTLSPKQLGQAIGVSESSLKRWIDSGRLAVSRTEGGHRRVPIEEAVRFIRDNHYPVLKPELLGLTDLQTARTARPDVQNESADPAELLFDALNDGRSEIARGLVLSLFLDGAPVAEICDGPVALAMRRIGQLWKHGPEGIFIEHRATDLCLAALSQVRHLIVDPPPNALVAVGGGMTGDPYLLPSLMVATTLRSLGWREVNLGGENPVESIIAAIDDTNADLAWLAVSVEHDAAQFNDYLRRLARHLAPRHGAVVFGGRFAPRAAPPTLDNVHRAGSMAELAAYASGRRSARPTSHARQ